MLMLRMGEEDMTLEEEEEVRNTREECNAEGGGGDVSLAKAVLYTRDGQEVGAGGRGSTSTAELLHGSRFAPRPEKRAARAAAWPEPPPPEPRPRLRRGVEE